MSYLFMHTTKMCLKRISGDCMPEGICKNCGHLVFIYDDGRVMHFSPSMYSDLAKNGTYGTDCCCVRLCFCDKPEIDKIDEVR
jgi:hypothetical protein